MNVLTNPALASCPCGWEIACGSHQEKQRREQAHRDRWHTPTPADVAGLMAADPSHSEDYAAVEAAIILDGRANGSVVDPNRVRSLIPSWVQPQVIGTVYAAMKKQERLRVIGSIPNMDVKGRNVGKPIPLYELIEHGGNA